MQNAIVFQKSLRYNHFEKKYKIEQEYLSHEKIQRSCLFVLTILIYFLSPHNLKTVSASYPSSNNSFSYLHVPTQVTKIGNTYYISDCYHDQIIYSDNLNAPLKQWKLMTNNVKQPHALASDGTVYLVVDSENNRPHYVSYEPSDGLFYVWSSLNGTMYLFRRTPQTTDLTLVETRSVLLLDGLYVRSFTIIGDSILLSCVELSTILQVSRNTFEIEQSYPVPNEIAGMVQIVPIEDYFYLTISSDQNYDRSHATIIRTPPT